MIDQLIRSKRRTVSIEITRDAKVIVRAPLRAPEDLVMKFVRQRESWIKAKQQYVRSKQHTARNIEFKDGEELYYMGLPIPLSINDGQLVPLSFDGTFQLSKKHHHKAKSVFIKWYRERARAKIGERLEYYSSAHNIPFESFKITGASRRWGSCSAKNTLNFSWRLIMAPLSVIDYVVVHELAHVVEKNHSRRFWARVAQIIPEHKQYRKWLKENDHRLTI